MLHLAGDQRVNLKSLVSETSNSMKVLVTQVCPIDFNVTYTHYRYIKFKRIVTKTIYTHPNLTKG